MIFSAVHLLPLLLVPLIVGARPAEPNQPEPRDARQLLAPVQHYMPMVQPGFVPNYRYGYNPLVRQTGDPSDNLESRIGFVLLFLLPQLFDDLFDDRFQQSNSAANLPFLNRPLSTRPFGTQLLGQRPLGTTLVQ